MRPPRLKTKYVKASTVRELARKLAGRRIKFSTNWGPILDGLVESEIRLALANTPADQIYLFPITDNVNRRKVQDVEFTQT